ncbi:hypothetical protein ACFYVL_08920 [Streptomyces sp. NPDC004111]|uniref:hypothetical protein n=1 Tax=Streptomyces sp. NPDC004111 TaxID=3364690 RepID=UPI00369CF0F0
MEPSWGDSPNLIRFDKTGRGRADLEEIRALVTCVAGTRIFPGWDTVVQAVLEMEAAFHVLVFDAVTNGVPERLYPRYIRAVTEGRSLIRARAKKTYDDVFPPVKRDQLLMDDAFHHALALGVHVATLTESVAAQRQEPAGRNRSAADGSSGP